MTALDYYLPALGASFLHFLAGFLLACPAAIHGRRFFYVLAYNATIWWEIGQWVTGTGDAELRDLVLGWTGTGLCVLWIELSRHRTESLALAAARGRSSY